MDGSKLLDRTRVIKDQGEIATLRKAAALTDQVMERVLPKLKEGITQRAVELEVEYQAGLLGAADVSFPATVKFIKFSSEVAATPNTYPVDKGLVKDTSIAFDIGFVLDGYCSDFGRSFFFGNPDSDMKQGYAALHGSILDTVDKAGFLLKRACDLFPNAKNYLDRKGFGKYLPAYLPDLLGHSLGIEVHERPWLTPIYEEELRPGTVLAMEPRLWNPGKYYIRVEDMVLLGQHKNELLTNFDREIFAID